MKPIDAKNLILGGGGLLRANFRFFLLLLLILFLPKINDFFRIYFIQEEFEQIDILSQIQWLNVILEVFKVFLIVPLFYQFGKENPKKLFYFTLCFCFLFVFPFVFFVPSIEIMLNHTPNSLNYFLVFQWLNGCLEIVFSFFVSFLLYYDRAKDLCLFVFFQFLIAFGIDLLLLNENFIQNSVYTINISTAFSYSLVVIYFWYFIFRKIKFNYFHNTSFKSKFKNFSKLHFLPAFEQLIDNLGYIFVILVGLNLLQKNADYFLAMSYFWGFLLVPILAFGEVSKKIISSSKERLNVKLRFIFCVNGFFVFLLILSYFFISHTASFLGLRLREDALFIINKLYPCYIIFIFSYAIKCIFYAKGLFQYTFLVSLVVNLLVYLPAYLWCDPSFNLIISVFSYGIYLNFFLFLLLFFYFFKVANKENNARKLRFFKRANHHLFRQ